MPYLVVAVIGTRVRHLEPALWACAAGAGPAAATTTAIIVVILDLGLVGILPRRCSRCIVEA